MSRAGARSPIASIASASLRRWPPDATSCRGCTSTRPSRRSSARRAVTSSPATRTCTMRPHYFWHTVAERRTYCTGGTSNGESWNTPPGVLARELSGYTEESLRHLQHAQADASRVRLDRGCAPRRLPTSAPTTTAFSACSTPTTATSSTTCRCRAATGSCSARRCTISGAAPAAWRSPSPRSATASTFTTPTVST